MKYCQEAGTHQIIHIQSDDELALCEASKVGLPKLAPSLRTTRHVI